MALDAAQLGSWQYDPRRRTLSGDERADEIFDVPSEATTVEEIEKKRVHPDDVERVHAAFEAAIDPTDPKPLSIEYRVRRGDGKVRWVEIHGLAYFEGTAPQRRVVAYVGTVQDITERKEREEKEHLLMREINHRAKNMLSVVASIAHQTASRNPAEFVERFSERIQALSANQDLLVRNEWQGVDVEDLVRAQLAAFADLIGGRITVSGPKLFLNPASAQAIGLALHELATNAKKNWGALNRQRPCQCRLGNRQRYLDNNLGRARRAARISAEAARVRHHGHGRDGAAQPGWRSRARLCPFRSDLAPDMSRGERALGN
jgi:PAS domain S-box-containing protein